jgi:hypothetical protein
MSDEYKLGQTLWYVPIRRHGQPCEVTIAKVGRQWLTLSNGHRACKEDLVCDGKEYVSPGRCYLSEDEYRHEVLLKNQWDRFRSEISSWYRRPNSVSHDDLSKVMAILGITTKDAP